MFTCLFRCFDIFFIYINCDIYCSKFTSNLTEEIKINCTNGTLPWNMPIRYLETQFQPENIEKEHSLCIERISSTTIDIIENNDGELTWLPLPKPGI